MPKILIWLTCILLIFALCPSDSGASSSEAQVPEIDTARLNRLVLEGNRKDASLVIAEFLNRQPNPYHADLGANWLHLAILLAWSDDITASQEAFKNHTRCLEGSPDDPENRSDRLLFKSLMLSSSGLINQAADSLIASITIRPAGGKLNLLFLADSYGQLARLYKLTGDYFESSRTFERSISLNREMGRTFVTAGDLTDMSSVISFLDINDRRADSILMESLATYTLYENLPAVAQALNELGVLFNRRGDFNKSLGYFLESLSAKLKMPGINKQELIVVTNNIGHCYLYLGKADSARIYFLRALNYARQAGRNPASFYANLGANYGIEEDYSKAIEYFQKALTSLDPDCDSTDLSSNPKTGNPNPLLADFTAYKAHAFRKRYFQLHNTEDLINGLNTFMIALEMMDTLRFMYSFDSKPYLSSEAKFHYFSALDLALELHEKSGDRAFLEQAFQLSERNKSALLNEYLRINQARNYLGTVAPWIHKEDSIKQLINRVESALVVQTAGTGNRSDSINLLKARVSDLTNELRTIGITAKRENPDYFQMIYSNSGYSTSELRSLLVPGEALVDYTIVRDKRKAIDFMVVFVLTKDTLFSLRDTLSATLRQDIELFRNTITPYVDSRIFLEFCRLSNNLYKELVAPIERFDHIDRLIILPDEELGFLPFEIFVSDTVRPKGSDFRKLSYLNRKYQISYISSHQQLYYLRTQLRKKNPSILCGFAPFSKEGARIDTLNLPPLENSGNEVSQISKIFKTKIFNGKRAGEESLRKAFIQESVINLSTHGIVDTDNPMRSRILLNPSEPDGSLYLFEMLSLKINSPLVILNACNTGTGKLQVGEGIMSMARGFQFAGVPSVITTLWSVDDQSSGIIIRQFFKNLHQGMDQREALTRARNTYLDQTTKAGGAPYFWAGHILIGDTGTLNIQHKNHFPALFLSLTLTVLILTFLAMYYKKVRD